MWKILINLQYEGANYHGWIKQKKSVTVQSTLEKTIEKVIKNKDFKIFGVSKTDAGVHALAQKVIIQISFKPRLDLFIKALNKTLPSDIFISSSEFISLDFDLHDVKQKTYTYTINNSVWNLQNNRFELLWNKKIIICSELQNIFDLFVGDHDFKLFSGLNKDEILKKSIKTKRLIDSIAVIENNKKIIIEFKAIGFIRHQIRYIVQASLACYEQKVSIAVIQEMLNGNGHKLPFKADAKGLILKEVVFNS